MELRFDMRCPIAMPVIPTSNDRNQTVGTASLMYVLLGKSGFGAVDWRE